MIDSYIHRWNRGPASFERWVNNDTYEAHRMGHPGNERWPVQDETYHDMVRRNAEAEAREWLMAPFVVFDTKTTGLRDDDEIIQIGIVDHRGGLLLETLIKPTRPIPSDATRIHGIDDLMVKDAPPFEEVYPAIRDALHGKRWAGYNLSFDTGKLKFAIASRYLTPISPAKRWEPWDGYWAMRSDDTFDVMHCYAEWWGDWNDYHGNYKWQKLSVAAERHQLTTGQAHNALADAMMTLKLIEFMGTK